MMRTDLNRFPKLLIQGVVFLPMLSMAAAALAQTSDRTYPKEIHGYKVERAVVEIKKPEESKKAQSKSGSPGSNQTQSASQNSADNLGQTNDSSTSDADADGLIKLGKPQLERVTPLGITFEVPIAVAPVKQSGHVDFLLFQDMVVNGRSVEIDEYHRAFDLPNKQPLTLPEPLRFYIDLPGALLAALGDWNDSKETWPVTGRVYVCGKFKKSLFSFKRCVPVELKLTMRNPLRAD